MTDIVERLRERTAFRYAGNCKCGNCQLVPREDVDEAAALIASQAARIRELEEGLGWIKGEMDGLVNGSHPDYQIPHYVHDGKGGEEAREPDDSVMIDRVCDAVSGRARSLLSRKGGE